MPVYFIQASNGLIKIGYTSPKSSLETRLRLLENMSPLPLRLLGIVPDEHGDTFLHRAFKHLRCHGEWFEPGQDLLEHIHSNAAPFNFGNNTPCKAITAKGKPCPFVARGEAEYCEKHGKKRSNPRGNTGAQAPVSEQ